MKKLEIALMMAFVVVVVAVVWFFAQPDPEGGLTAEQVQHIRQIVREEMGRR